MKRLPLLILTFCLATTLCGSKGQVRLTTGVQLAGELEAEGARLVVRSSVDGGEVVRRFTVEQVERLRLESEAQWSSEKWLEVHAALGPFLDDAQQERLLEILQDLAAAEEFDRVWSISEALLPYVRGDLQGRAEKLMLLAAWQLERPEAEGLAGQWMATRGLEDGALGQAVKAELLWRRGEARAAFAVVAPVLAGARTDTEYLDRCRALAVLALLSMVPETELYPESHPATLGAGKIFSDDLGEHWPQGHPQLPRPQFPLFMEE